MENVSKHDLEKTIRSQNVFFKGPFDRESTTEIEVCNLTSRTIVYKLKSNHHKSFKIEPKAIGVIKAAERRILRLTLLPPTTGRPIFDYNYKLLLQTAYVSASKGNIDPISFWQDFDETKRDMTATRLDVILEDGKVVVPCDRVNIFLEEDGDAHSPSSPTGAFTIHADPREYLLFLQKQTPYMFYNIAYGMFLALLLGIIMGAILKK